VVRVHSFQPKPIKENLMNKIKKILITVYWWLHKRSFYEKISWPRSSWRKNSMCSSVGRIHILCCDIKYIY
jgi:hypothetical protein